MRGKGPGGMRTRDAVHQVISKLQRATGNEIFDEVKKIYTWGDHNILRHIMAQTINLQPGYYEWIFIKQREKCLFLCEDGHFELYIPTKHGNFSDGNSGDIILNSTRFQNFLLTTKKFEQITPLV